MPTQLVTALRCPAVVSLSVASTALTAAAAALTWPDLTAPLRPPFHNLTGLQPPAQPMAGHIFKTPHPTLLPPLPVLLLLLQRWCLLHGALHIGWCGVKMEGREIEREREIKAWGEKGGALMDLTPPWKQGRRAAQNSGWWNFSNGSQWVRAGWMGGWKA